MTKYAVAWIALEAEFVRGLRAQYKVNQVLFAHLRALKAITVDSFLSYQGLTIAGLEGREKAFQVLLHLDLIDHKLKREASFDLTADDHRAQYDQNDQDQQVDDEDGAWRDLCVQI